MMAGVASNMVAFVGKEKTAANLGRFRIEEADQQGQSPRYASEDSTNEQGTTDDIRVIDEMECGDTVTHVSNTSGEAT